MRLFFLLCALFAATAEAGPITATASGCVTSLPTGASWTTTEPTGFQFFAAYSLTAGCEPTLEIPTNGFHEASTLSDGRYRVQVPAHLLPACGRVQFDAHAYNSTGLDPFGLTALVYDTGIDCVSFSVPPTPDVPMSVPESGSAVVLWALGWSSLQVFFFALRSRRALTGRA